MKTNKVPNEIFIFEDELQREDHVVMYGVNQDKGIDGLIEYTRTEAFIEKAVKRLEHYLDNGCWIANDVGDREKEAILEDFKKFLEG